MRHPYRRAGAVIVAGSVVWLAGISPVPRVYTTHDPAERLRLLLRGERGWVTGHHVAAAGTAAVPMGFAALARAVPDAKAKHWVEASAAALLAGAPLFVYSLSRRASDLERFAYRCGSNVPFLGYSWLHIAGLAALGTGLLRSPAKRWVGLTASSAAVIFAGILLKAKDIPPFVFYVTEATVGGYLMVWDPEPPGGDPAVG
ncbi:hypothetical protein ACKLTP_14350 [Paenarthrobacter ureafaciens]|uniref:hypothetical protein n=1 Tax=Paenarthrobacter TaxID=1742992 RepID=UPI00222FF69B|nr:hypothetical protein [Paenarthrobacter sp. PAE-2]MCW3767609.1 hypothetical protein [Paenarthrobacter sp. PAE-2]